MYNYKEFNWRARHKTNGSQKNDKDYQGHCQLRLIMKLGLYAHNGAEFGTVSHFVKVTLPPNISQKTNI